jgi:nitrous oxidase accessory protein NosD
MSYTLRGRLESRLAAASLPFIAACAIAIAIREWWPVQLAALMTGVGVGLDLAVYHRALTYQAGWLAVPLGLLELGATMGLAVAFRLGAPLGPALAFFAGSWLFGQALAHAALPFVRLSYAEDGGELGRTGNALFAAAPISAAAVLSVAWATQPPTVHLAAGVHQGPLVVDRAQKLVGEPGTVVRGGILITADDVVVRDVAVLGGQNGIEVREAENVVLERVRVLGATLDGISARRASVTIRDCDVRSPSGAQGIDISFAHALAPSLVEDCRVSGGLEGIVSHLAHVRIRDNRVSGTSLRAITVTEMSMGKVDDNVVTGALGVGIYCGDYSQCAIEDNRVSGMRPDRESGISSRAGLGVVSHFGAVATLADNDLDGGVGAFVGGRVKHD